MVSLTLKKSICLFAIIFLCSGLTARVFANVNVSFKRAWPKLPQPWYFNSPRDVAVDPENNVYIVDSENHRIVKFTETGDFIRSFGSEGDENGQFRNPVALAIGGHGRIYVADDEKDQLQVFSSEGEFITAWGERGFDEGQFYQPADLALDASDNVYIVDEYTARVQVFTSDGEFLRTWGSRDGSEEPPGTLRSPNGIAINSIGWVYVVDSRKGVQVFNQKGEFLNIQWGELANSALFKKSAISIDSDNQVYILLNDKAETINVYSEQGELQNTLNTHLNLKEHYSNIRFGMVVDNQQQVYIADSVHHRIQKLNTQGEVLHAWKSNGSSNGFFSSPTTIASDSSGKIFICDWLNNRIQVFNDQGEFLYQWGKQGSGDGEFKSPQGIAIDHNDLVYITDSGNHRIQVFDTTGRFIKKWGKNGLFSNHFNLPTGIAVDTQNKVFIADSLNLRVTVFNTDGEFLYDFEGEGIDGNPFDVTLDFGFVGHIAISPQGELFISDFKKHQILIFDKLGKLLRIWGNGDVNGGEQAGEFRNPRGLSFDANGLLYITDSGNNRIQVFNQQGEFITAFGEAGFSSGQFSEPHGLNITANNQLYVVDSGNQRIQAFSIDGPVNSTTHPFKAIILAGGGPPNENFANFIWDDTVTLANKAYAALRTQGLKAEQIKYLTAGNTELTIDQSQSGKLEAATLANLQENIVNWAADADDVIIYMIDHGGPGSFLVNPAEILTDTDLADWTNQLAEKIPGRLNIIIEACKSASFFPSLMGDRRHLIASSDANQAAIISNKGLNSFSYFFWNEIISGADLLTAFRTSRQGMSSQIIRGKAQNAQLESDADGLFTANDFTPLENYCLGNCITYADIPPLIDSTTKAQTLTGETELELAMQVASVEKILQAWVIVTPPGFQHADDNEPVTDLESFQLVCDENQFCKAAYTDFTQQGDYRLNFYVQNQNYRVARSPSIVIKQQQGKVVDIDDSATSAHFDAETGLLEIDDVLLTGGGHYKAHLKLEKDLIFKLVAAAPLETPVLLNANNFDTTLLELKLHRVAAFGQFFQVEMRYLENTGFKLIKADPLP